MEQKRELKTMPSVFRKHANEIDVAAISADGKIVLTVANWGEANVYDIHSGEEKCAISPLSPLHEKTEAPTGYGTFYTAIDSAALNDDGSLALLGLNDGSAVAYSTSSGECLATLRHKEEIDFAVIRAVRFSHNGQLAAVGFCDRTVGLWSTEDWSLIDYLQPQECEQMYREPFCRDTLACSLSFSQDDRHLFVGNADGSALTWALSNKEIVFEAKHHVEEVIAIHATEKTLHWCTSAGSIWQAKEEQAPRCTSRNNNLWAEAKFSKDGRQLLARRQSGPVLLLNMKEDGFDEGKEYDCLPITSREAVTLAFSPTSSQFCHAKSEREIVLRHGNSEINLQRDERIVQLLYSPDGKYLATEGWDKQVELWDTATGRQLHVLRSPGSVGAMAFSPDGKLFAAGELGIGPVEYKRQIRLWECQSGKLLQTLDGDEWQIHQLIFTTNGKWIISVGNEIKLHSIDGEYSFTIGKEEDISYLTYIETYADGRFLINYGKDYEVRHQDNAEKVLCQGKVKINERRSWQADSSGKRLFVASENGMSVHNIVSGEKMQSIDFPFPIPSYPFPEEERENLHPNAHAYLWQTPFGPYVHVTDGPRGWAEALDTSPDGQYALVPCERVAAIVSLEGERPEILGTMQVHGKLRAFTILVNSSDDKAKASTNGRKVLAINNLGTLFSGTF